jgi:hypothetical protein
MNAAFTSEYLCPYTCSRTYLELPPRVCFPIATSAHGVHYSGSFPRSPMFRPQRFSRSRRLAPPWALQARSILLPRPGFSLQGFPSLLSRVVSRRFVPSCRSGLRCCYRYYSIAPQPQSIAFRVLLQAAIRCNRQGVNPAGARSPLVFSASSGLSPHILVTPSRLLRSWSSRLGATCPPSRWPSAYPSMCGLPFYL